MYSRQEILDIAKKQIALDYSCNIDDFDKKDNIITEKVYMPGRRLYRNDKCFFKMMSFNGKLLITTDKSFLSECRDYYLTDDAAWTFQISQLMKLDKKLKEYGHKISYTHIYYLPLPDKIDLNLDFEVKWYEKDDILQFKDDERFDEAFDFSSPRPNELAVAALDGDNIMGMAGASSDGEYLWQIGINVFNGYEGKGIASKLVTLLKDEILSRGKVPFYGTCESHIISQMVAYNSGFIPAWSELGSEKLK